MSSGDAAGGETTPFGPVQILVLGFDGERFTGEILPEFRRLEDDGLVRLVDLLVVTKHEDGKVESIQTSDLTKEEAMEFGAIAGALVGIGASGEEGAEEGALLGAAAGEDGHVLDEADVWYLADAIPVGSSAAIALIEHRWAIPLRDKIVEAGGTALADEWIHPADLIAVGLAARKDTAEVGA